MRVVAASLAAGCLAAFTAGSTSSWQPAAEVAVGAVRGDIALSARGGAIAVWSRPAGGRDADLVASYRPAGSRRWPPPRKLDTTENPEPQVAVNDRGDAVVVWEHFPGDHHERRLFAATRSSKGSWDTPTPLSPAGSFSNYPDVGIDAAGNATAISVLPGRVEAVYRPAGGSWQEPRSLAYLVDFSLAVGRDGHAVVVGRRRDATTVVSAIRGTGQTWDGVIDLDQGDVGSPSVAVGPGGATVVVWSKGVAGNNVVRAASFESERGWGEPEDLSFSDGQATDPDVAVDDTGAALSVWNAAVDVEASYRPSRGGWQRPAVVSPPGARLVPSVAMSANGRALAVWKEWSFDRDRPVGAAAFADGRWEAATEIASVAQGTSAQPGITVDGRGDGIAFWTTSADRSFRAAFYDAGGPLLRAVANSGRPTISGVRRAGRRLTCSRGTWTGQTPITYALVWLRNGRTIGHGRTYAIRRRDVGAFVGCRVTARNAFGASTAASKLVRVGR
jgi:hypothetical protein